MKTRIIHTQIHFEDDWFNTLTLAQKYLFMYLFTNSHIGQTGIYHLTKRVACLETGATVDEWAEACDIFEKAGKARFYKNWVYVPNASKYASYRGEKNEIAHVKEYHTIPKDVITYFGYSIDTLLIKYDTAINHKSEIINNKSVNRGVNKEEVLDVDEIAEGIERAKIRN